MPAVRSLPYISTAYMFQLRKLPLLFTYLAIKKSELEGMSGRKMLGVIGKS